ncbi:MAG TPA: kelch repeat-containing protein, partial [Actinomycetota bacterium]
MRFARTVIMLLVASVSAGCTGGGTSERTVAASPAVPRSGGPQATSGTGGSPEASSIVVLPPMHVARAAHTATRLLDGRILVAGGFGVGDAAVTATAEVFDPRARRFHATGSMSTPRQSHTATLLRDGRVLVAGGLDADGNSLDSAEIYDPATGRFTAA